MIKDKWLKQSDYSFKIDDIVIDPEHQEKGEGRVYFVDEDTLKIYWNYGGKGLAIGQVVHKELQPKTWERLQKQSSLDKKSLKVIVGDEDIKNLEHDIDLEIEAINTYNAHILTTKREHVRELLEHIVREEEHHIEELRLQLQNMDHPIPEEQKEMKQSSLNKQSMDIEKLKNIVETVVREDLGLSATYDEIMKEISETDDENKILSILRGYYPTEYTEKLEAIIKESSLQKQSLHEVFDIGDKVVHNGEDAEVVDILGDGRVQIQFDPHTTKIVEPKEIIIKQSSLNKIPSIEILLTSNLKKSFEDYKEKEDIKILYDTLFDISPTGSELRCFLNRFGTNLDAEIKDNFLIVYGFEIKSSLNRIAISVQKGEAYIKRYLEPYDYEYDEEIQKVLKNKDLSYDEKIDKLGVRVIDLFYDLSDDDVDIRDAEWDQPEIDKNDLGKLIYDYEELEKESSLNKQSKFYLVLREYSKRDFPKDMSIQDMKIFNDKRFLDQKEMEKYAREKGYKWKSDNDLIFGGYFVNNEGEVLFPDEELEKESSLKFKSIFEKTCSLLDKKSNVFKGMDLKEAIERVLVESDAPENWFDNSGWFDLVIDIVCKYTERPVEEVLHTINSIYKLEPELVAASLNKQSEEELVKTIKDIIHKRVGERKFKLMESMEKIENRIQFQINQGEMDPEQIATYVIDEYDEAIFEAKSSIDKLSHEKPDSLVVSPTVKLDRYHDERDNGPAKVFQKGYPAATQQGDVMENGKPIEQKLYAYLDSDGDGLKKVQLLGRRGKEILICDVYGNEYFVDQDNLVTKEEINIF